MDADLYTNTDKLSNHIDRYRMKLPNTYSFTQAKNLKYFYKDVFRNINSQQKFRKDPCQILTWFPSRERNCDIYKSSKGLQFCL